MLIDIPKDEDITTYVGRNNAKLDISIVFQMVFPVAVCEIEYSVNIENYFNANTRI